MIEVQKRGNDIHKHFHFLYLFHVSNYVSSFYF